jgi:type III restriction enzyme
MMRAQESKVVLTSPNGEALVQKTPGVCGGEACIRNTRIMVWLLVSMKRQGMTEAEFLHHDPSLTAEDLAAAWEYYRQHRQEVEEAIAANEGEDTSQWPTSTSLPA